MRELDLAYHIHHPAPTSRTFPNGEVDDDGLLLLIPTKIRMFLQLMFTTIILFHHHRFIALSTIRFDVELAVVSTYIIFVEENKEEDVVVVVKRKPTRGAVWFT